MRQRKFNRLSALFSAILSLVLVFSIFISETLCWQSPNQEAVNETLISPTLYPVELLKTEKLPDGTITDIPLPDAYFYLYYENGTQIGGRYKTDENGKISVNLPNGSYYFEEVEPPFGMTFDTEDGQPKRRYYFTVTGDETETILIHAYNVVEFGSLSLEKIFQNSDGSELSEEQLNQEFSFIITFSDGGTYYYTIGGSEPIPYTSGDVLKLKHGQVAQFIGIPKGVYYRIEELVNGNYVYSSDGSTGRITPEGCHAVFVNTAYPTPSSELTVTKEVVGEGADPNKEFEFTAVINGETYTFKLKDGESKTFENLPWNTDYTVWEEDESLSGYIAKILTQSGTLIGNKVTLPFVNVFVGRTPAGNLQIEKEVVGENADPEKQFTFSVEFSDGGTYSCSIDGAEPFPLASGGTLTLKAGQTALITDLPPGVEYIVKETNADGFLPNFSELNGIIVDGETAVAHFVNNAEEQPPTGKLIVTKEVIGEGADPNKEFEFTAVIGGQTYTFVLKNGESKTFEDILIGTDFTVTETDYSSDGYKAEVQEYTGTINDLTVILPFINHFELPVISGNLIIEKEIIGEDIDTEAEFTFEVTFSDEGTYYCVIDDGEPFPLKSGETIVLKHGQTATIKDLPDGVSYTITEIEPEGFLPDFTEINGVIISGEESVVHFINRPEISEETGNITVSKELLGEGADLEKEFEFTAVIGDQTYTFVLKNGETKVFENIPIGTDFIVTEKDYTAEGYIAFVQEYVGTVNTSDILLEFVNMFRQPVEYGDLIIEKEIVGPNPDPEKEFTFEIQFSDNGTYSCSIDDGEPFSVASGGTITLKNGQKAVFTDIPEGVKYTVRELDSAGYLPLFSQLNGTIIANTTSFAHFINNTEAPLPVGRLIVTKEVLGDGADLNKEFEFTAIINGETYTFTLKNGESKIFEDLPIGTQFIVTEKDYTADGYLAHVQEYVGTVNGLNVVLPFVNVYQKIETAGSLKVEKELIGEDTDPQKEFTFEVEFSDGGTYLCSIDGGEPFSVESGGTFVLKNGQSAVFTNLPDGIQYIVREIDPAGCVPDFSMTSGTIIPGNLSIAHFVNRVPAEKSTLRVTKVLEGNFPESDLQKEFEIILILNGQKIEFTLKPGETIEFEVPEGSKFEVIENDYTDQGYTTVIINGNGIVIGGQTIDTTVINTFTGKVNEDIHGEKTWVVDDEHKDLIPESIKVQLMDGDRIVEEIIVTPDENGRWTYNFNVPKYDENGNEIHYTIVERPVNGFATSYEGYNIKNTYIEPISMTLPFIEKIVDGEAPETTFSFVMTANGNAPMPEGTVDGKKIISITGNGIAELGTIQYDAPGVYTYTLTEINEHVSGWTYDPAVYTLTVTVTLEDGVLVADYVITKNGKPVNEIVFTNSYETPTPGEQIVIQGQKTWDHGDNPIENRPKSIIVCLYANGVLQEQKLVDADSDWKYSFNMPKYDENGEEIIYTIVETPVPDYEVTVNGYDLHNTYIPPVIPDKPDVPDPPVNPDQPVTPGDPDQPKTGDTHNVWLWITLLIISSICIGSTVLLKKKKTYTPKHAEKK